MRWESLRVTERLRIRFDDAEDSSLSGARLDATVVAKDTPESGSSVYLVRLAQPFETRQHRIDRLLLAQRHRENWASHLSRYVAVVVSFVPEGKPTAAAKAGAIATIKRA